VILVDTHVVAWLAFDQDQISNKARTQSTTRARMRTAIFSVKSPARGTFTSYTYRETAREPFRRFGESKETGLERFHDDCARSVLG
jgi:hypothetical protein